MTYKGLPLYTFVGDKTDTSVTGNVKDAYGTWWVVNPSNPTATPKPASSSNSSSTPPAAASSVGISY